MTGDDLAILGPGWSEPLDYDTPPARPRRRWWRIFPRHSR